MISNIVSLFQKYPDLAIFLSLAIGYFIGKIKIGNFSLGSTTGTLLAALFVGQMNVTIDPIVKSIFFALFIFTIGYKVGPQFFASLKSSVKVLVLSVIFCFVALGVILITAKIFSFDPGTAGGVLAGALTQSAIIGTTESALKGLSLSKDLLATYQSNVAVSYAVTYVIGTLFAILLLRNIIPGLLKFNLESECKKFDKKIGVNKDLPQGEFNVYSPTTFRSYRVQNKSIIGNTVKNLQSKLASSITLERIKRDNKQLVVNDSIILIENDEVIIAGAIADLVSLESAIGKEIDSKGSFNLQGETLTVWVTSNAVTGKTLQELHNNLTKSVYILEVTRQGHAISVLPGTIIHKGDTIKIMGVKQDVESIAKKIGYPERPTDKTDLIFLSIGIILGTLLGLLGVKAGNASLGFGIGGGILILGLIFGWLRSFHPTFGFIPNSAQWLMQDLGLNLFIAVVGIMAGPQAIVSLKTSGISVLIAGLIVVILPHLLSSLIGRWILKMNPVDIIGTLCGAGTCTAALNAVKDQAKSPAPVLSYTPGYAIGNILLTIWGPILVALLA